MVPNDETTVLGLEATDYTTFSKADKEDEWRKHFDNLVQNFLGNPAQQHLTLELIRLGSGKTVAMVAVAAAPAPVWLRVGGEEEFYIRRMASAVKLSSREAVTYCAEKWPKG